MKEKIIVYLFKIFGIFLYSLIILATPVILISIGQLFVPGGGAIADLGRWLLALPVISKIGLYIVVIGWLLYFHPPYKNME